MPVNKYYSYFLGSHAAFAASGGFAAIKLQRIAMPSKHIMGGDIPSANNQFNFDDPDKDDYTQNPIDTKANFHNGLVNLLYYDGHVAAAAYINSTVGYFDKNTMATHYDGVLSSKPASETGNCSYLP